MSKAKDIFTLGMAQKGRFNHLRNEVSDEDSTEPLIFETGSQEQLTEGLTTLVKAYYLSLGVSGDLNIQVGSESKSPAWVRVYASRSWSEVGMPEMMQGLANLIVSRNLPVGVQYEYNDSDYDLREYQLRDNVPEPTVEEGNQAKQALYALVDKIEMSDKDRKHVRDRLNKEIGAPVEEMQTKLTSPEELEKMQVDIDLA